MDCVLSTESFALARTAAAPTLANRMKRPAAALALACAPALCAAAESGRPNIVVILSDDQGYADAGFQGSKDCPTPNLDRLAREGVRCTQGYVTHPYCSPSRAALLTGRYQSRFGHERNPDNRGEGLPTSESLLPQHLREAGYTTGWVGKWHLGVEPRFRPENRGFDKTFGFYGGGHHYLGWKPNPESEYNWPVMRDGKETEVKEHLTLAFGREAAGFVAQNRDRPWFLYLAFNAPHSPHQPTRERLERFSGIRDKRRRAYVAQISLMDDAIGEMLEALRRTNQERNTLVFFLSDNGGALLEPADNAPLRGNKGMLYEGGVRVPFVVSWPAVLPAGTDYAKPVSSLDIFATSLAAAGVPMPTDKPRDGVSLLSYLRGENNDAPHGRLFWRTTERGKRTWAARVGDDKLVWIARHPWIHDTEYFTYSRETPSRDTWLSQGPAEIFDITKDPCERSDRSRAEPGRVHALVEHLAQWEAGAAPLAFPGSDGPDDGEHPSVSAKPPLGKACKESLTENAADSAQPDGLARGSLPRTPDQDAPKKSVHR